MKTECEIKWLVNVLAFLSDLFSSPVSLWLKQICSSSTKSSYFKTLVHQIHTQQFNEEVLIKYLTKPTSSWDTF